MKHKLGWTLLILWLIAVTVVMARVGLLHNLPLFPDASLTSATPSNSQWAMTHVLGKGCKCSNVVYNYLLKRGPQENLNEAVVLLGGMPEQRAKLEARGFTVTQRNPRDLASEKAVGVPFLLITSAKGEPVYAGGYAASMIDERTPLQDLDILHGLRDGKHSAQLPIYGCAVSHRIQKLIDPLALKYKEPTL